MLGVWASLFGQGGEGPADSGTGRCLASTTMAALAARPPGAAAVATGDVDADGAAVACAGVAALAATVAARQATVGDTALNCRGDAARCHVPGDGGRWATPWPCGETARCLKLGEAVCSGTGGAKAHCGAPVGDTTCCSPLLQAG